MAYSGVYRGIRFRSLLELSVIRHFENEGYVFGQDFIYESVRIPYGARKTRNYIVDFSIPESKLLVEVKPSKRAENKNNRAKRAAAEAWCLENGWSYVIITEQELAACGEVLTLEEVAKIPEVNLGERALRALRRKAKRKAKKKR